MLAKLVLKLKPCLEEDEGFSDIIELKQWSHLVCVQSKAVSPHLKAVVVSK